MFRFSEKRRTSSSRKVNLVNLTDLNSSPTSIPANMSRRRSESGLPFRSLFNNEKRSHNSSFDTGCIKPLFSRYRSRHSTEVIVNKDMSLFTDRTSVKQKFLESTSPITSVSTHTSSNINGSASGSTSTTSTLSQTLPDRDCKRDPKSSPQLSLYSSKIPSLKDEMRRWKLQGCSKSVAFSLQARDLAAMLSASLVNYDEELASSYGKIKSCLAIVFTTHFVNGAVLAQAREEEANELVKLTLGALEKEEDIGFCLGLKVGLRGFFDSIIGLELDE